MIVEFRNRSVKNQCFILLRLLRGVPPNRPEEYFSGSIDTLVNNGLIENLAGKWILTSLGEKTAKLLDKIL